MIRRYLAGVLVAAAAVFVAALLMAAIMSIAACSQHVERRAPDATELDAVEYDDAGVDVDAIPDAPADASPDAGCHRR